MFRFLARTFGLAERESKAFTPEMAGDASPRPAVSVAAAPVHVLLDDGLVRLVDGHLTFAAPDGREEQVRLDEVSQLSIFGGAGVTSPCLRELMRRGIPGIWRSPTGYYLGQTVDLSGQLAAVRRAHCRAVDEGARALAIACTLVHAKLLNARGLLRRNTASAPETLHALRKYAKQAERASSLGELLGLEGAGAAAFYAALPEMIAPARRKDFPWGRPPPPATN